MEVVSLHFGQAGLQVGDLCWAQYCMEHGISENGQGDPMLASASNPSTTTLRSCDEASSQATLRSETRTFDFGDSQITDRNKNLDGFTSFFQELSNGNYTPRALLIDLEPTVIDEIRGGKRKELYSPNHLIKGTEDAANNFARGFYSVGQMMLGKVMDPLRKWIEACDKLQGFMMFHSFGGGTGSGFNALVSQEISMDYGKSTKLEVAIFPSPRMSTAVVEPYNAILNTHNTMENTDCVFLADNEAMYNICQNRLEIDSPNYNCLNRLLAMTVSSITASLRFKGSLNADFTDFQTNLVPFPRIHFPIMSFAPIVGTKKISHETLSVVDLTLQAFNPQHRLVTCDSESGRYMACCLLYRGDVTPKDVNCALAHIKGKKSVSFVEWCPTGFKVGINNKVIECFPGGEMASPRKTVCMICNTSAIQQTWEALNKKYAVMLRKKAFVHWYLGEGMEATDFVEAQSNCLTLEKDYKEIS